MRSWHLAVLPSCVPAIERSCRHAVLPSGGSGGGTLGLMHPRSTVWIVVTWCDGPLVGFDLETTGVDPFEDLPVSYALVHTERGTVTDTRTALVDPGRPIPAGATAVHGISTERARREGQPLEDAVDSVARALLAASASRVPVVGMNVRFDLTMVDTCLRRAGRASLAASGWCGPVIDLLVIDRHVDRWRAGSRRLGDLCAHYGVELVGAHECVADVQATLRCLGVLAGRFQEISSMEPAALDAAQGQWHWEWAEDFDRYRVARGQPPLESHEFQWPLSSTGAGRPA